MSDLHVVASSRGNAFMLELLDAVASEARALGVTTTLTLDRFPDSDGVFLCIPHETFPLFTEPPTAEQRARTIGLCVEMPGTEWFDRTAALLPALGAAVSINRSAAHELGCGFMQLGYHAGWDQWGGDDRARDIDVAYLGSIDDRRAQLLAGYADALAHRETRVLIPPLDPKPGRRPDFLLGKEKHELLASSKVLLNLHRGRSRSLEWVRVLEAICNGCVVVTERSWDHEPLVPGEHLVVAAPESLGVLANLVIDDVDRLASIRSAAYEMVRTATPLSAGVERLLELAASLDGTAPVAELPVVLPGPQGPPPMPDDIARLQRTVKSLAVQGLETKRLLQDLVTRDDPSFDEHGVRLVASSPAYDRPGVPRVSVGVPLFNHATVVLEALLSASVSELDDIEVVVYDDASTDDSAQVVTEFVDRHPWLRIALLQGRVNGGPSVARNVLTARARADYLFFLDSDNAIYPRTLGVLAKALDDEPRAAFAYSTIASIGTDGPVGLLSSMAWDPELLRRGNYIDTMSMVRRSVLHEVGGFCEDVRVMGWEDYDLWCRFAEMGALGVHVPQLLGRYRWSESGLLQFVAIDQPGVAQLIRARSPRLFRGELWPVQGRGA